MLIVCTCQRERGGWFIAQVSVQCSKPLKLVESNYIQHCVVQMNFLFLASERFFKRDFFGSQTNRLCEDRLKKGCEVQAAAASVQLSLLSLSPCMCLLYCKNNCKIVTISSISLPL